MHMGPGIEGASVYATGRMSREQRAQGVCAGMNTNVGNPAGAAVPRCAQTSNSLGQWSMHLRDKLAGER